MAAMDELETNVAPWKWIMSQILDVEHRADPNITGNIELVGVGTKSPQNFVWTPCFEYEIFS